jgi:paraquat-inducible protein B
MSVKTSKTMIGAFVIGGLTLAVAGILVFGSGRIFSRHLKYVLYFDTSVKGLRVGAPLMCRGVKLGEVTDILIRYNPTDQSLRIPVIVEANLDRITNVGGEERSPRNMNVLVEKGMRAQLQMQSFVTGQLMVALDFFPDQPPRYAGIKGEYKELPTIPSRFEQISKRLEKIPIDEIFAKLTHALEGIDRFVSSPSLKQSIESLSRTVTRAGTLLKKIDGMVDPVATDINATATAARNALLQAEKTLKNMGDSVAKDSKLLFELNNTLREVTSAARSIRILTETIEKEPEILIRGRGTPKGE